MSKPHAESLAERMKDYEAAGTWRCMPLLPEVRVKPIVTESRTEDYIEAPPADGPCAPPAASFEELVDLAISMVDFEIWRRANPQQARRRKAQEVERRRAVRSERKV